MVHGGGLHWEPAQKQRARQGKARQTNSLWYIIIIIIMATGLLATYLPTYPMVIRLVGWDGDDDDVCGAVWNVTVHRETEKERTREFMQFERVRVCGCIAE
jgi:hypothetical protein